MSDKILVACDCTCADTCPQGRIGSRDKCRILRDPRIEATIEPANNLFYGAVEDQPSDIELVTIGTLRRDIAGIRSRLEGNEHEGENVKRRLSELEAFKRDIVKVLESKDPLTERIDNLEKHCEAMQARLDHHNISLPQEASINRVFKGGWVNVYLDAAGPWFNPRPWSTREEANKQADQRDRERRIACIQIPNITEGEGL